MEKVLGEYFAFLTSGLAGSPGEGKLLAKEEGWGGAECKPGPWLRGWAS